MKLPTTAQKGYLSAAEVFHCATRDHFVIWMTGKTGRHSRTERALPALVKKGYLVSLPYGKKNLYATPDRVRLSSLGNKLAVNPYHGLCVTDIILRWICRFPISTLLSERVCRAYRWGIYPECAFLFVADRSFLLEFCTRDNVEQGKVKLKANKYREVLDEIQFSLNSVIEVFFILDIRPNEIEKHVQDGPFRFMAYDTFKDEFPLP